MSFYKQLNRHDPENGVFGDCYRTAIAGLLGKHPSDVPHVYDKADVTGANGLKKMQDYLGDLGLSLFQIAYPATLDQVLLTQKNVNPDALYLLSGMSRSRCNHTVIAHGGQIVWDPSLNNSGIVGPCDDGYFWVEVLCHKPSDKGTKTHCPHGVQFNVHCEECSAQSYPIRHCGNCGADKVSIRCARCLGGWSREGSRWSPIVEDINDAKA